MNDRTSRYALCAFAAALLFGSGCRHREREPRTVRTVQTTEGKFVETVQARVSFDLSCPPEQISLQMLGPQAVGAMGCGRRLSYTCLCTYHIWTTCTQAICSPDALSTAH